MFRYFRDPDNFAFKVDQASPCSVCGRVGLWFDAEGFYGANEIECICDDCLAQGRLKELEMETNEALEGTEEEKDIIRFRTPALPTWQDRMWPFVNGQYCVFERMASKSDFESKEEFKASFSDSDKASSDLEWLWDVLPDERIANHKAGNFDVSVYLFTCDGKKYCTWDSS